MHSYADFCKHYELDPRSNDARQQFWDYQTNASIFESILAKNHELPTSEESSSGQDFPRPTD